jgi:hypothetical protein
LSSADEGFQAGEIFGAIFFDPGQQWPGIMQAGMDDRMFLEEFDEGEIRVLVGLFEHMAEIAARLVSVNQKDELKAISHVDNFSLKHHTV